MQLFHFLSSTYGLDALKNQQLKVSRFDNLNDPFELQAAGTGQESIRRIIAKNKSAMARDSRLLCCSKSYSSPVLWGHYADSHKGVALELSIPSKYVHEIDYVDKRIVLTERDFVHALGAPNGLSDINGKLLRTKYKQWEYEDEARVLYSASESKLVGTLDFVECSTELKITGIVLGALCKLEDADVADALPIGTAIELTKARTGFKEYDIVPDLRRKNITINSSK